MAAYGRRVGTNDHLTQSDGQVNKKASRPSSCHQGSPASPRRINMFDADCDHPDKLEFGICNYLNSIEFIILNNNKVAVFCGDAIGV
jgi:hypothetical protein